MKSKSLLPLLQDSTTCP